MRVLILSKHKVAEQKRLAGMLDAIDEQSKRKTYELYNKTELFSNALTNNISDRELFLEGANASLFYEEAK